MGEESVRNFMQDVVKEHNLIGYDIKVEPVSSGGANYSSILYNVILTKGNDVVPMFAKVAAVGEKLRSQVADETAMTVYDIEMFVYNKLSKIYEKLQEELRVPEEHRLIFTKCYGCKPDLYEETIIMENLGEKGYQSFDRFKTFDWEYAKSAVGELAKLHGLSLAYCVYYPEEFHKLIDGLTTIWVADNVIMKNMFDASVKKSKNVINEENKERYLKFLDAHDFTNLVEYYKRPAKPVLGHGDFRPSNLMHKIHKDGSVDIKILDLQTIQGISPVVDLLYFIYTGSDEIFRATYYDKLLEHYYTELQAILKRLNLNSDDVYSRSEFYSELKSILPLGLLIAIFTLPIITVDVEDAPKFDENMDMTSLSVHKTNNLYTARINGVVNDYVKLGVI